MREASAYIRRTPDLSGLAPRVAGLFSVWNRVEAALDDAPPGSIRDVEGAYYAARDTASEHVAAFEPRTLQEATSLLQCVFLDEDAESAWGLPVEHQRAVLATVRRFLAAYVAAQPEPVL